MAKVGKSYRLESGVVKEMEDYCDRVGVDQTQFVTEAVQEKLGVSPHQILDEVSELRDEVRELRGDLAKVTKALLKLIGGGGTLPAEEADRWVKENLRIH